MGYLNPCRGGRSRTFPYGGQSPAPSRMATPLYCGEGWKNRTTRTTTDQIFTCNGFTARWPEQPPLIRSHTKIYHILCRNNRTLSGRYVYDFCRHVRSFHIYLYKIGKPYYFYFLWACHIIYIYQAKIFSY